MRAAGPHNQARVGVERTLTDFCRAFMRKSNVEIEERFWSKVDHSPNEDVCWLWRASKDSKGYGTFKIGGKRGIAAKAHRIAYELERGEIPPRMVLDHLCRTHACVNPWHLEAVTNQENVLRGRSTKSRTHCSAGHEYNEQNYRYSPATKGRYCAQCNRDRARVVRAAKHAPGEALNGQFAQDGRLVTTSA